LSKDKKPQQPQDTDKEIPVGKSWVPDRGGRAYDDVNKKIDEVTRRPTPPLPEEKD
jgi:hypothetical protein